MASSPQFHEQNEFSSSLKVPWEGKERTDKKCLLSQNIHDSTREREGNSNYTITKTASGSNVASEVSSILHMLV